MSTSELVPIQFSLQYAPHAAKKLTSELAENLFAEKAPAGAKSQVTLQSVPGLKSFGTLARSPVRGIHRMGSRIYAVGGDRAYTVNAQGDATDIGEIGGDGAVLMHDNGIHVWMATSGPLYAVNQNGVFELSESNIVGVAYQDGFLFGAQANTQNLLGSAIGDATTIPALAVAKADGQPGYMKGCISDHGEVLGFTEQACEIFVNIGDGAFLPFARRGNPIEKGTVSGASLAKAKNAVFFLGHDLEVYAMAGYNPQPISTESIADLIRGLSSPETARGFIYTLYGHTFYVLLFSDMTLAYDLSTKLWHRIKSQNLDRWRVSCHTYVEAWGKNIVGDYVTGDLYELDPATYDENGAELIRRGRSAPIWRKGHRYRLDQIVVDVETGVGLNAGQGSDPQAMLRISNDGGTTWSNELTASIGKIGETDLFGASWTRLGAYRNATVEVSISDPVPVRINGLYGRWTEMAG